jgi:hypothetical protein
MSRILEPNTVTILPTNTCTAQCRHCSMNSGPDRHDALTGEELENIIDQLCAASDISVIVFSGGETTLLGEHFNRALRRCKKHGVLSRLVTNAFWAHTPEAALEKLRELRTAGLDELNISTDDFHLPYISLQKVKNAYQAAIQLDFVSVVICNAYGADSWLTPERLNAEFGGGDDMKRRFDANGKSMVHERKEGQTQVLLSNGVAMQLGRGVGGVSDQEVIKNGDDGGWAELYRLSDEIGGCPWVIRSAAVSPKGNLLACCGTEIDGNPILDYGSIKDHSMEELLNFADDDLVTNMISVLGPVKLKQLLEQIAPDEIEFKRASYRGYCEVCEDLIKIEKNRQALYKYQGLFLDAVMQVREAYRNEFTRPDGKVRIPPATNFVLNFGLPGQPINAKLVPLDSLPKRPCADAGSQSSAQPTDGQDGKKPKVMLPVVP